MRGFRNPNGAIAAALALALVAAGVGCDAPGDDDVSADDDSADDDSAADDDDGCIEDDDATGDDDATAADDDATADDDSATDDDATADDDDATADDDSADDDDDTTGDDDDTTASPCPAEMTVVDGPLVAAFCVDRYEASRPDATDVGSGVDESRATSRPLVLPWRVADNAEADTACAAAGKRLCSPDEWYAACVGPGQTAYPYGDVYEPETCNGIDTFCYCAPYEDCYWDCGADFHLLPTGSLTGCVNGYGAFDLSGNLWEHVAGGDDTDVRGGAYNCAHSNDWQRCDYVPGWSPSAKGFRCCRDL